MKRIFRKNQVVITTLAFLIAIAGYISYDRSTADQKQFTSTNATAEGDSYDIAFVDGSEVEKKDKDQQEENETQETEEIKNPGEAVLTGTLVSTGDQTSEIRMNREQVRAQNKETLNNIIENAKLSDKQKEKAVEELVHMTELAEKEADAEMLLEAKGFTDVVVSIGEENCDVVVDMGETTDAKCAQVEDIVKRKTGIAADKIIITPVNHETENVIGSVD